MGKKDLLSYIQVLIEISKGATELAGKIQARSTKSAMSLAVSRSYLNLARSNSEAAEKLIALYQEPHETDAPVDPDELLRAANDFQLSEKELFGREVCLAEAVDHIKKTSGRLSTSDKIAKAAAEYQLAEEKRGRTITLAEAVTHVTRAK